MLDLPLDNEFSNVHDGKAPDCMHFWYINHVTIPGEATVPDEVAQSDLTCIHQVGVGPHFIISLQTKL